MKQSLLPIIIIISLLGCTTTQEIPYKEIIDDFNKENNIAETQYTLEKINSITLPIDSLSLNHSYYPIYFDADSTHYYITGNTSLNALDFYDLNKKKLVKRNFYDKTGPEGINGVRVAAINNLSSIYLYSQYQQVVHTNYKGDVLNFYKMPSLTKESLTRAHILSPLIYYQNSLLLLNSSYYESFTLSGMPIFKFYKLDRNIFEYSIIKYPDFFSKYKCVYLFESDPRYITNGNIVVYRYGFSNIINTYNLDTEEHNSFPIKSKYQNKPLLPFNAKNNSEIDPIEEEFHASYHHILYDKYQNCYYSVFQHEALPTLPDGTANNYENKPLSILIMNETFQYMGEFLLPPKTYFRNFLVSKDGLMILRGHMNDTSVPEDEITFDIFQLKEIK